MQANYRYSWALSEIRRGTPLLQMYESGLTPDQVKEAVVELLDPYFENQSLLVENAISILLPEAVSIARLNNDAWSLQMINQCLATHRGARAASAIDSLQGCSAWVPATMRGLSAYWSHLHLEHDKNALALDEFAHECLAVIGSLIEGSIQPYLKELLHQIRISRGEPVTVDQLESLTLGNIIDELIRNSGYPELFAPLPWGIRLNQWRNIAQHLSSTIAGNEIICRYGTPPRLHEIRLTRDELLEVASMIMRVFSVLKLANTFYFIDNLDEIRNNGLIPTGVELRREMQVLNFSLGVASQGFELIDFDWNEHEVVARIREGTSMTPNDRRPHLSQFPFVLWNHTKAAHVTVEYQESDGTPNFRVSVNETNCDLLQRGEIDSRQFMNRIEMTDLKTGTVIPPLPEGGS